MLGEFKIMWTEFKNTFLPRSRQYVQAYQPWLLLLSHTRRLTPAELDSHSQRYKKPRMGSWELLSRSGVRFWLSSFLLLFIHLPRQTREIYTKATSHLSRATLELQKTAKKTSFVFRKDLDLLLVWCFTSDFLNPFLRISVLNSKTLISGVCLDCGLLISVTHSWSSWGKCNYEPQQKIDMSPKYAMIWHNLHKPGFQICH